MHSLRLHARTERWPLAAPFRITGYVWDTLEVLLVQLEKDGHIGRGEAAGVYYKNDRPSSMLKQIEDAKSIIEDHLTRGRLQTLLPPGGARNALDCAFWDLEAKITGTPVHQTARLETPRPLLTTMTCGVDTPEAMAATAKNYRNARAIKVKLTGEATDQDRVQAIRDARPEVWLGVDANQGFSRDSLEGLMPTLVNARVQLIEQPFPIEYDHLLDGMQSPISVAADESAQTLDDLPRLKGRYDVINIKLDKCGGLTEGLAMARAAKSLGLQVMVGNMMGTSLAMAPAWLLGQMCSVADLDGPLFLTRDRSPTVIYDSGLIACPDELWGH